MRIFLIFSLFSAKWWLNCYKKLTIWCFEGCFFGMILGWKSKLPPIRVEFLQKTVLSHLSQRTLIKKWHGKVKKGEKYRENENFATVFYHINNKRARVLLFYAHVGRWKNVQKIRVILLFKIFSYFFKKGIDKSFFMCYNAFKIE